MERPVRVRFAPSPTGSLHIGGVRTALYNYLFARQHGGKFLLRIEDTDQNRFVPGAESYINEALSWLGIQPDEGVEQGGPCAPYRQSERGAYYQEYTKQLLDQGFAYYAFDTPEEIEAMRVKLKAANVLNPQYDSASRMGMKNSLTLSKSEVEKRLASGAHYVVRLKVPAKEEIRLYDMIRGWVNVHSTILDDKVLMKSDGMPTYHLANVVDDHLMEISHVIRGEEWLPSAPIHVLLYQFLGWESTMPKFVHLPLLLKPDGNGKLSKRDGEMMGFPVFPLQWTQTDAETGAQKTIKGFREEGYLPKAMINFLAFLGWNPGTTQELFSLEELIDAFSIEKIGKSGTRFDINKAKWYNQQYLHQENEATLKQILMEDAQAAGKPLNTDLAIQLVHLLKDRIHFSHDLWVETQDILNRPEVYDAQVIASKWNAESAQAINLLKETILTLEILDSESIKNNLGEKLTEKGIKIGKVMQAIRVALTGKSGGPDLIQIMVILGKNEVLGRIELALQKLPAYESH